MDLGPRIRWRSKTVLDLEGTPLWVAGVLLLIILFGLTLASVFYQSGEMARYVMRTGGTSLGNDSTQAASWPVALLTLALTLPWVLVLFSLSYRSTRIDRDAGLVTIRPLAPTSWYARQIPFDEIAGAGTAPAPAGLWAVFRRDQRFLPVLELTNGRSIALAEHGLDERRVANLLKHIGKFLR